MSSPAGSRRCTWDEFAALADDDRRELIDGELIEVEVPFKAHEKVVSKICFFLESWLEKHDGGLVLASGYRIRISDDRGVMPDVQYFGPGNPAAAGREDDDSARPDVAVEVVSPSSREYDQATKLDWYAEIGVPEYWLIDPEARTLLRYVLKDGDYSVGDALRGDTVFKPASFPGLEIPLVRLWLEDRPPSRRAAGQ